MKLYINQLQNHLKDTLAPVYFVSGDEPFQLDEAASMIRKAARAQGYSDRQVYHVDRSFDWEQLNMAGDSMSLFAERKLLELRLPSGKPGDAGSKALQAYCEQLSEDNLLLVISGKLEGSQTKSKWYRALDSVGVMLAVWPVDYKELPGWLEKRMRLRNMQPDNEALAILAEQVEGNLLAADQEIEKLHMLHGDGPISAEQMLDVVANSARFDAFALVDMALSGDAKRVSRILHGLRAEGEEILQILGALLYQLRLVEKIAFEVSQGQSIQQALQKQRIWDRRKNVLIKAVPRYSLKRWQTFLLMAQRIERMSKGRAMGKPWDELLQLTLRIAGVAIFPLSAEQIAIR